MAKVRDLQAPTEKTVLQTRQSPNLLSRHIGYFVTCPNLLPLTDSCHFMKNTPTEGVGPDCLICHLCFIAFGHRVLWLNCLLFFPSFCAEGQTRGFRVQGKLSTSTKLHLWVECLPHLPFSSSFKTGFTLVY